MKHQSQVKDLHEYSGNLQSSTYTLYQSRHIWTEHELRALKQPCICRNPFAENNPIK